MTSMSEWRLLYHSDARAEGRHYAANSNGRVNTRMAVLEKKEM